MKNLTNSEILELLTINCVHCNKHYCHVKKLILSSSYNSISQRLNIERKNKVDGIVEVLEQCILIDPKAQGDLTL